MKKTAILATAVAAAMMAGSAAAETTVYGKLRMSIDLGSETVGGVKDKGVNNNSSRFGFKGMEDLGNGLSAKYQIEVGYDADDNDGDAVSNRIGLVGLVGDFGTVQFGQQWTPSYLLVRGPHDPFDSVGGNLVGGGFPAAFRVNDAIAYINKFGPVTFAAATVASNDPSTDTEADSLNDHTDIAVSIPVGPVKIGIAIADTNVDAGSAPSPTAINVGFATGPFGIDVALFDRDIDGADDWTVITGYFKTGSGKITAQIEDNDTDDQTSIGYSHKLSKRSSAFIEVSDGDLATDETNIGLHVNF